MKELQYINNFSNNISLMQVLYCKTFDSVKEELGISMGEIEVLLFLSNNPKHNTATEIVKYRNISKAYVSKAVTILKDSGMLQVDNDIQDGRVQHLTLTEKSAQLTERLNEVLKDFFTILTKNISVEDLNKFVEIADKLTDNMRNSVVGGEGQR